MRNKWIILPAISLVLSIIGIWHALPMHVVGDEEALIGGALKMIELKTLIPSLHPSDFASLYYPPLISYLVLIAIAPVVLVKLIVLGFSVGTLQDYFVLNQNIIWIAARLLSAFAAAGTVAVLFQTTKRLFNEKIAWLSSFFLIFSFFHVVLSHWVRHWTFTTFFVYLTVLCGILFVQKKEQRYVLFAAVVGGLGFGVSYIGSLGFFVVLVYWWYKRSEIETFNKHLIRSVMMFGVFAIVFGLLNVQELYRMLSPIDGSLSDPKNANGLFGAFRDIGGILIRQELVVAALSVVGIFVLGSHRRVVNTVVMWLMVYALLIYGAFHLELRYVYLIVPALCLLSGLLMNQLLLRIPSQLWRVMVCCLIFAWPVVSVVNYERLLLKNDTREQAIEWIRNSAKQEEPFLLSSETMILPRRNEALEQDQEMGRIRASERYQLQVESRPASPMNRGEKSIKSESHERFQYYNMHFWRDDLTQEEIGEFVQREQPRYFIADYWSKEKLTDREHELMKRGGLITRFTQSDLIENIDANGNFFVFNAILFTLDRLGPTVDIYQL